MEGGRWASAPGRVGSPRLPAIGQGVSSPVPAPSGLSRAQSKSWLLDTPRGPDPLFLTLQRKQDEIKTGTRMWSPRAQHPEVGSGLLCDCGHWCRHPSNLNQGPGRVYLLRGRKAPRQQELWSWEGGGSGGGCGFGGNDEVLCGPQGAGQCVAFQGKKDASPVAPSADALREFTALLSLCSPFYRWGKRGAETISNLGMAELGFEPKALEVAVRGRKTLNLSVLGAAVLPDQEGGRVARPRRAGLSGPPASPLHPWPCLPPHMLLLAGVCAPSSRNAGGPPSTRPQLILSSDRLLRSGLSLMTVNMKQRQ